MKTAPEKIFAISRQSARGKEMRRPSKRETRRPRIALPKVAFSRDACNTGQQRKPRIQIAITASVRSPGASAKAAPTKSALEMTKTMAESARKARNRTQNPPLLRPRWLGHCFFDLRAQPMLGVSIESGHYLQLEATKPWPAQVALRPLRG